MINEEIKLSASGEAILLEISEALQRFALTGETWSLFANKMSLTTEDRELIRDFLGKVVLKSN